MIGSSAAFIAVVTKRSYSRNSGFTSLERHTTASGKRRRSAARAARSWAGLR